MERGSWLSSTVRHVRLQNAMVVLCAVLVGAYGTSMYSSLRRAHDQIMTDATGALESIARSAEVDTNRSIFEIDAALLGVERMLDAMLPEAAMEDRAVRTLLNVIDDQTMAVRDILIFDHTGRLLNKSVSSAGPTRTFADRPFFKVHQDGSQPSLFIGAPERSRATGGWSVIMSRPLMHQDKVFGVIAAEVPITTFTDFYRAVVANSGVRVRLMLDDGTLVASEPHQEEGIGHPAVDAALLLGAAQKRRFGVIDDRPAGSDNDSDIAYTRVPARPMILAVSRVRADILRQWHSDCVGSLIAFVVFAITAMCLTWLMVRALDRQQQAAAEIAAGEERLKRQSELLQSTLESMGEGLSVFDRGGRLVAWNERFLEMLELPSDLSPATTLRDILAIQTARGDFGPPELAMPVDERTARFFHDVPVVRERVTGTGHTLQIRRRAMPGGGVVTLYSDITERKAAEVRMAQAWAQAELANRAKTDFLANMSHELRTPLNAIIGFSEILSAEHLGPLKNARYLEYAHDIHASGLHLLSIINDVLDMSKIEAGKFEINEEEIAVGPLLASTMRMVRERARIQRVELVSEAPSPDHVICVDERAMKQCLLNLLSNAIKFSKPGSRVTVATAVDDEGRTVLSVADQGIGMSEAERERALQPFGQAHSATTRTYGGTGLGLPITKGLVEAHGGSLVIDTASGVGTRVSIILPPSRTRLAAAPRLVVGA
jgi:signal transduction histidine kinase